MADKKVERNLRSSDQERPQTPTQKMTGALSDSGNVNMAEDRDKGKTALLDRFRDRDERYRREQSIAASAENASARPSSPDAPAEDPEEDEGSDTPSD